tara:strand:+ start:184 stop:534 length:351 start_codon:yes stop_codon:yes gene_type:complete
MPGINKMTRSVDESSYMKPKMSHKKPMLVGDQKKIDMNKDGKITKEDFSMLRAKMAMPKKDSPMNFKAMDFEMAKAMDYNQGKPMMYHDKPKMAHGDKPKMGHKNKAMMYHTKKKK